MKVNKTELEKLAFNLMSPEPNMNKYYSKSPGSRKPLAEYLNYEGRWNRALTRARAQLAKQRPANKPKVIEYSKKANNIRLVHTPNLNALAARLRQMSQKAKTSRPVIVVLNKAPKVPKSPPKAKSSKPNYKMNQHGFKIIGPTGRYVLANGSSITLAFLRNQAARRGVNISGLTSKLNIAHRIYRGR